MLGSPLFLGRKDLQHRLLYRLCQRQGERLVPIKHLNAPVAGAGGGILVDTDEGGVLHLINQSHPIMKVGDFFLP